jgi:hypothetical protein
LNSFHFSSITSLRNYRHVTKRAKLAGRVRHFEAIWTARHHPDKQVLSTIRRRSSSNFRSLHDVAVRPPAVRVTCICFRHSMCVFMHV